MILGIASVSQASSLYTGKNSAHCFAEYCCVCWFPTKERTTIVGVAIVHITAWHAWSLWICVFVIIVKDPERYISRLNSNKLTERFKRIPLYYNVVFSCISGRCHLGTDQSGLFLRTTAQRA